MNIDEIMEMVMSNEDVKNLSYKKASRKARFFFGSHRFLKETFEEFLVMAGEDDI